MCTKTSIAFFCFLLSGCWGLFTESSAISAASNAEHRKLSYVSRSRRSDYLLRSSVSSMKPCIFVESPALFGSTSLCSISSGILSVTLDSKETSGGRPRFPTTIDRLSYRLLNSSILLRFLFPASSAKVVTSIWNLAWYSLVPCEPLRKFSREIKRETIVPLAQRKTHSHVRQARESLSTDLLRDPVCPCGIRIFKEGEVTSAPRLLIEI